MHPTTVEGSSGWRTALALWRLGRYRFLLGGFVLYALGAAIAWARGPLDIGGYLLGQGVITATQLMTHYCNDYFDRESDAANRTRTPWSGGSGVLPAGALAPRLAHDVALGLGAIATVLLVWAALRGHAATGMAVLFVAALVLSWEYSAPPLRLHAVGLGPLTAAIVVGGLTPLAGYGMQGGPWSRVALLAVVPIAIAQFALILVLDFPDAEGDALTGKRTLVVQLGQARAVALAVGAIVLAYAILPLLVLGGLPRLIALGTLATLPLGAVLVWTLARGAWRRGGAMDPLAFRGVLWFAVVTFAELASAVTHASGFVLGGRGPA